MCVLISDEGFGPWASCYDLSLSLMLLTRCQILAHLSWKLKWAFLIAFRHCLSVCLSICKLSYFQLLKNHWANFNQTWHKVSWGEGHLENHLILIKIIIGFDITICVYWFELFSQVSYVAHGPFVCNVKGKLTVNAKICFINIHLVSDLGFLRLVYDTCTTAALIASHHWVGVKRLVWIQLSSA